MQLTLPVMRITRFLALITTQGLIACLLASNVAGLALCTWREGYKMEKKENQHLPGRSMNVEAAVAESTEIIEGMLLSAGNPDPGAPGQIYYSDAIVRVDRWIKGSPRGIHDDTLKISYTVQKLPANVAEQSPEKGSVYLFCLVANDKYTRRAIKIISPDDTAATRLNSALHH